ncbi:hypothetical protein ACLB2K_039551 [Fragaria x ananassa]
MKVYIEVISKEIIKPSSPTPDHLRHYQFSFLDQLSPPVYNSLVLFYEFNGETQPRIPEISSHLKTSLSEVITLFYPLAGRVKENKFIDCNDDGIPYLEAQVKNCKLADVLKNPIPEELNKFVPFELDDTANEYALGIQLNIFECGGFAIGQCVSHKLADGSSYFMFSKTWAAIARGVSGDHSHAEINRPEFISANLFPPKDLNGYIDPSVASITKNKVTKRFVFDASNIEVLRLKYGGNAGLETDEKCPSRVEALSAFIWSRFVAVTKDTREAEKLYMVIHAVNLRPRFDPPLPEHSFGNLYRVARTISTNPSFLIDSTTSGEEYCNGLTRQVREEISKIDKDYLKRLQQGDEHLSFIRRNTDRFMKGEIVTFSFSSLCRLPIYDSDFGWGRPTWVGSPARTFKNLVHFLDTKEGDGIEAYICLEKEVMAKFETDSEFLAYVKPNDVC